MPGRLFLTHPIEAVAAFCGVADDSIPPEAFGRDLAPGEQILCLDDQGTPVLMRWGMIMSGRTNARRRPVMETIINARSETVFDKTAFVGVRRGIVPASGWYEWTGKSRRKTRWQLSAADGGLLAFAAVFDIWSGPGGISVPQVATITCEPNDDIRKIHHRMGVLLDHDDRDRWLAGDDVSPDPAPNGSVKMVDLGIDRADG